MSLCNFQRIVSSARACPILHTSGICLETEILTLFLEGGRLLSDVYSFFELFFRVN